MLELAIAVALLLPVLAFVDWRVIKEDKGAELVEFAVVVPLLFMVLFGMFWFARSFNIYETMVRAAREGAAYGSRPVGALDGPGCNMGFPCTSEITGIVLPFLDAAHIKESQLATIPVPRMANCYKGQNASNCPISNSGNQAPCDTSDGKIYVCRCVDMAPAGSRVGETCGVAVVIAYPWKFPLPFSGVSEQIYTIKASVIERQEF